MTDSKLPPIPEPDTHCFDEETGKDVWSHSGAQLTSYALAAPVRAVEQQPADEVQCICGVVWGHTHDGWEIVDMPATPAQVPQGGAAPVAQPGEAVSECKEWPGCAVHHPCTKPCPRDATAAVEPAQAPTFHWDEWRPGIGMSTASMAAEPVEPAQAAPAAVVPEAVDRADRIMARIDEYAASYHVDAVAGIDSATTPAHRKAIRAAISQAAVVPLPLELSAEDIRAIRNSVEGPKGYTEGVIRKAFEWGVETARSQPQAAVVPEAVERDAARLDYLQRRGATVEILSIGGGEWKFRIGGRYSSADISIRAAIDAAMNFDRLAAKPTGKEPSP